jgi:hypothetical protein
MNHKLNSLVRPLSARILSLIFRSILLTALFLPIGSPTSPALAATTPVTLTITELRQTGSDFDLTTLGDFYAQVSINGNDFETDEISHLPEAISCPAQLVVQPVGVHSERLTKRQCAGNDRNQDSDFPDPDDTADKTRAGGGHQAEVDMATGNGADVNWPQAASVLSTWMQTVPRSVRHQYISVSGDAVRRAARRCERRRRSGSGFYIDIDLPGPIHSKDVFVG